VQADTHQSYKRHKKDDFEKGNDNWKVELILNVHFLFLQSGMGVLTSR